MSRLTLIDHYRVWCGIVLAFAKDAFTGVILYIPIRNFENLISNNINIRWRSQSRSDIFVTYGVGIKWFYC